MNRLWDELQILIIEAFFLVRGAIRVGNDYLRLACLLWASGPVGAFIFKVGFGKLALLMQPGSFSEYVLLGAAKWLSFISALMPVAGYVMFFWYAGPLLIIADQLLPHHFAGMHPDVKARKIREEVTSITGLCTIIGLTLAIFPIHQWVYGTLVGMAIIVASAFYNESAPHFKVSWWAAAIGVVCAFVVLLGGPDNAEARLQDTAEYVENIDFGSGSGNEAPQRIVVKDGTIPILYPDSETILVVAPGATGCIPPAPGDVHVSASVINTARTQGLITMVKECDVDEGIVATAASGQYDSGEGSYMYSFQILNGSSEPVKVTVHSYSE